MKNKIRVITSLDYNSTEKGMIDCFNSGIDEFYFGFMPKVWINKFGWEVCLNRRPYPLLPHFLEFEKAKKNIEIAHRYRKKIYLAINEHMYAKQQYRIIIPLIRKFMSLGVDGIMIADPALVIYLKAHKIHIPIHLSVGAGIYNNETVKFFKEFGIKRFVLPRKLRIDEIKKIVTASPQDSKFEIFLMGEWCKYNDDYCFNVHGYNKNEFCKSNLDIFGKKSCGKRNTLLNERVTYNWCGICILTRLREFYGRMIFKIPLRSDVFRKEETIGLVMKILKNKHISDSYIQKQMRCNRLFCAYEIS